MEKKIIRKLILQERKKFKNKYIENISKIIYFTIIQRFNFKNKKIGIYFPINNEIIFHNYFNFQNNKILIPKIENNKMYFCEINSYFLKNKNNYEIIFKNKTFQPKLKKNIFTPDVIIVPIIAFNEKCFRIGYGGGYYDKYLHNKKILKIGIAFDFQKKDFQSENHDVQLNYIFTEKRIYGKY